MCREKQLFPKPMLKRVKLMDKLNSTLTYSWNMEVESSYIITVKNHHISERMSARCAASCEKVGIPYKIWEAFDGTNDGICVPNHIQKQDWLKWLKCTNPTLVDAEKAAILSHISLWARCIEIDQPIVILEHDAVFLKKFTHHFAINTLIYLGCEEQYKQEMQLCPIAPVWALGHNFRFLNRAHAYSIDPLVATRLMSKVILTGINTSIDAFMRQDEFAQIQFGLFAVDFPENTSICNGRDQRNADEQKQKINYKLLF